VANKEAVGKAGPKFEMAVERGKIREFARATKSSSADYLDDPSPPVPPTFLTTVQFWSPPEANDLWREIDIDLRRLLHGEQEYVFPNGPPKAGTTLTAQARVESVFEKEGKRGGAMTFVITVTDFTDPDGNVVAQARSTAIETGRPPA
jgi:N-terminal half of MaoC dehydratase